MILNGSCRTFLWTALMMTGVASGQLVKDVAPQPAAPNLSSLSNSPLVAIEDPDREHGVELMLDMNRFDDLLNAGDTLLRGVPVDKGVTLDLDMTRVRALTPDAKIEVWSQEGRVELERPDVVLLTGSVLGEPDSTAFLALSEFGVNGWVDTGDQTYIISGGQFGSDDDIVVYNLTTLPEGAMNILEFVCHTEDPEDFDGKIGTGIGGVANRDGTCSQIDLAIDTDYEFTNWLFANDQSAATTYIETLVGATNTVYQRDVQAVFQISYIRLWADDTDPYFGVVFDYLNTLRSEWTSKPELISIPRDLAHVLTPTPGGGGVASSIGGICHPYHAYAASAGMNGFFPQPLVQSPQNWDMIVFPHELGHNCGAPHTHAFNPIIDGCGLGDCTGASDGTIMSYCHLCSPGLANINLEFHPTVQVAIEAFIGNSPCVETASTTVFTLHPATQIACLGELISFNASAFSTGSIAYQWYFNDVPIFGATASTYTIASVSTPHFGEYYLEATTICDTTTSLVATLMPCAPLPCSPADVTTQGAGIGDPGYGVPDEVITGADLNYYVNAWFAGELTVGDLTTQGAGIGDPGYGEPDGVITGSDIAFYVNIWLLDCPPDP